MLDAPEKTVAGDAVSSEEGSDVGHSLSPYGVSRNVAIARGAATLIQVGKS
jgi:hypothetical protein